MVFDFGSFDKSIESFQLWEIRRKCWKFSIVGDSMKVLKVFNWRKRYIRNNGISP